MDLLKQIGTVVLVGLLIACGTLYVLYKGECKKAAQLKLDLDNTKIELGVCKAQLAIKPTVIKKTEYVEIIKVVDSSGNVVNVSTNTTTHDEGLVIQPKEIIKEVIKEAPIRRWTLFTSINPTMEDVKKLKLNEVGLAYQPFKKFDFSIGGVYDIDEERVRVQGLIRF